MMVKSFRIKWGISQKVMAMFLRMTRSKLSLVECYLRKLNLKEKERFDQLKSLVENPESDVVAEIDSVLAQAEQKSERRLAVMMDEKRRELDNALQSLAKMKTDHESARMALITLSQAAKMFEDLNPKGKVFYMEYLAAKRLFEEASPAHQRELEIRIAGLKATLAEYERS
jgi:hypothetical protein